MKILAKKNLAILNDRADDIMGAKHNQIASIGILYGFRKKQRRTLLNMVEAVEKLENIFKN